MVARGLSTLVWREILNWSLFFSNSKETFSNTWGNSASALREAAKRQQAYLERQVISLTKAEEKGEVIPLKQSHNERKICGRLHSALQGRIQSMLRTGG